VQEKNIPGNLCKVELAGCGMSKTSANAEISCNSF